MSDIIPNNSLGKVAFIGVGNMGLPMAINLKNAGYEVHCFDINDSNLSLVETSGINASKTLNSCIDNANYVITMLPNGQIAKSVWLDDNAAIYHAKSDAILIDCSTIDIKTTRELHEAASKRGLKFIDAPVSGGVAGAKSGSLTIMVGGDEASYTQCLPVLEVFAKKIIHCGDGGSGQAAKMCNNMMLGINMIGACEAFLLAEKIGLSPQALFEVACSSSGRSWAVDSYCPAPELLASSPANNAYKPGFAAPMMLKDLKLAQLSANNTNLKTPMGNLATELYDNFVKNGGSNFDFSGIIKMLSDSDDKSK